MLKQLKETVRKFRLLKNHDRVLVGVSGGPDSLALLYSLVSLKKTFGLKLCVAHLDHGLRADSREDARFVEGLASGLGLPFIGDRIRVRKTGSWEESARRARITFLARAARRFKANKIALGHNLDDQAETVLMRILRGSGLYGLSAILPKRSIAGIEFIRPLIEIKRSAIENYLKRRKITFRRDRTNSTEIYFRNKVRNRLFPILEREYNRNIKVALANLAETSSLDYDYLDGAAGRIIPKNGVVFGLKRLERMHPALRRLLFRRVIKQLKGDTRRISFRHIREIEDLLFDRPFNSRVDLPQGLFVIKNKALRFSRNPL
jgi:tRNA(Ile)-lysidine synthase